MISYGNHGGRDGGTGRITGGHDGRPGDIGIAGDGIDSGGDGISWCRARRGRGMRELLGNGCKAVVPQANETCMVGLRIEPVVHSTI